jgi:hypothetical protein
MNWLSGLSSGVLSGLGAAIGAGLAAFGWLVVRRLGQIVRLLRHVAGMGAQIDDHEKRLSVLEGAFVLLTPHRTTKEHTP